MTVVQSLVAFRRSHSHMRTALVIGASALLLMPVSVRTQGERQPDSAVKALMKQVDTARDKFEGNLDDKLKQSTVRGATSETDVSAFLQDLQDNTKKLEERFSEDYAASAEVEVVLKQGNKIDDYMRRTPTVTKGRSEWNHLAATLKSLAGVYGTTFPLPEGASVRRMNDKETAKAAEMLAESADHFKGQVDDDKVLAKPDKETAKKGAEDLIKAAKTLKSRLSDGKPATAEAQAVVSRVAQLDALTKAHPVPLAAASWSDVKTALLKIQQSFGI